MAATLEEGMSKAVEAHKLGLRALEVGNLKESLSFFKTALQVNPKIIEYWVSSIFWNYFSNFSWSCTRHN